MVSDGEHDFQSAVRGVASRSSFDFKRPAGTDAEVRCEFSLCMRGGEHLETNTTDLLLIIEEETGIKATLETRLEDLPIDSLDFVELMQRIGEKFKEIPDTKIAKLSTVGDILEAVS